MEQVRVEGTARGQIDNGRVTVDFACPCGLAMAVDIQIEGGGLLEPPLTLSGPECPSCSRGLEIVFDEVGAN